MKYEVGGKEIEVYTLKEVAEKLGVSYRSVLTYTKATPEHEARLKTHRLGKNKVVSEQNLKDFINGIY